MFPCLQHCVSSKEKLEQRRRHTDARHLWNLYNDAQFVCPYPLPPSELILIVPHRSTIHSYLGLISMHHVEFPKLVISWGSSPHHACTHCDNHHHSLSLPRGGPIGLNVGGAGLGLPHEHGAHEAHQPFIDESDEARRDSSDYQTSGFGSPRRSAETLATDANDLEQRRAGSFEC